jgi:hypothetical protein
MGLFLRIRVVMADSMQLELELFKMVTLLLPYEIPSSLKYNTEEPLPESQLVELADVDPIEQNLRVF